MASFFDVVVFPELDGPASSATFTLPFCSILSAMSAMFLFRNVSDMLMKSFVLRLYTRSLREATVLRRLQKDGYLETYDREFAGRNRRYYRITSNGMILLDECRRSWLEYRRCIDGILLGEDK